MQFITTPATAQLCAAVDDYTPWLPSIEESIETGAQYSSAIPLYPVDLVNAWGQIYHGPVVLVTGAPLLQRNGHLRGRLPGSRDRAGAGR
jgi:hypothetical protein